MVPWLILMGLIWYGVRILRRAIRPAIGVDHDVVAEAERLTGLRRNPRRWARPVVATIVAWAGIMTTLTPIDPTLAVWVGGAVITIGAVATAVTIPDPNTLDDAEFDAALRNLLDQYS